MSKSDPIVYGVTITSNTGAIVSGVFKFDGSLKSGQGADFTYVIDPAWTNPQKPAWHVLVNRYRNGTASVIRRSMKECYQKDAITVQLQTLLDDMLADSAADSTTDVNVLPLGDEFSVETERKLAAQVRMSQAVERKLAAQNVSTQQATTEDLLEIPDFLKRT